MGRGRHHTADGAAHRTARSTTWWPQAAVDRFGNARGGVPSPFLDVPIARYEAHSTPGPVCALAGREAPLPYEVLANRYGDLQTYLAEFTISLDEIIAAGFLLEDDRAEILEAQTAKATAAAVRMTVQTVPVPDTLEQALSRGGSPRHCNRGFPGIEVSAVVPGPVVDRISTNARFSIECAGGRSHGPVRQGLLQRNRPHGSLYRRTGSRLLPRPRRRRPGCARCAVCTPTSTRPRSTASSSPKTLWRKAAPSSTATAPTRPTKPPRLSPNSPACTRQRGPTPRYTDVPWLAPRLGRVAGGVG